VTIWASYCFGLARMGSNATNGPTELDIGTSNRVDHEGGKRTAREAACWLSPAITRRRRRPRKKGTFRAAVAGRCVRDDGVCDPADLLPDLPTAGQPSPQTTRFHACRAVFNQSFLFEVLETVNIGRSRLPAYEAQRMHCACVCVCACVSRIFTSPERRNPHTYVCMRLQHGVPPTRHRFSPQHSPYVSNSVATFEFAPPAPKEVCVPIHSTLQ
jgi:hypothetical protein